MLTHGFGEINQGANMYHSTLMEAMLMCVDASAYCPETLEERLERVTNIPDVADSEICSLLEGLIAPEFMARMEVDVAREVLILTQEDIEITEEYRKSNRIFHSIRPLYESYFRMTQQRYEYLRDTDMKLCRDTVNNVADVSFLYSLFQGCLERNRTISARQRIVGDRIEHLVRKELFRPEQRPRYRRIADPVAAIQFWEEQLDRATRRAEASAAQEEDAERRYHELHEVHSVGQYFPLGMVGGSGPKKSLRRLNHQKSRITDRNQTRFKRMLQKRELYTKHLTRVRYCEERLSVANGKLAALNNRSPISYKVAAKLKAGDQVWDVRTQQVHTIDQAVVEGGSLTITCKEGTISGSLSDFR